MGRKDRHSKVFTAKGPRDRRVRLSAHTAIQFYDVQDRLGYDRPSKAVDWLMAHAKAAIDELAEHPRYRPATTSVPSGDAHQTPRTSSPTGDESSKNPMTEPYNYSGGGGGGVGFLTPPLDSDDAITETIKSFFPTAAAVSAPAAGAASSSNSPISYHNYSQAEDLRLSLQSFQDPICHASPSPTASGEQTLFTGAASLPFVSAAAGWAGRGQRMVSWNAVETAGSGAGGSRSVGECHVFHAPPQVAPQHPMLGQSQFFAQRGPLQSSSSPSVHAWMDPIAAAAGHQIHSALFHPSQVSVPAIGFASATAGGGGGGFSGFHIPARIQGEEEHDGVSGKPPSASSASHR